MSLPGSSWLPPPNYREICYRYWIPRTFAARIASNNFPHHRSVARAAGAASCAARYGRYGVVDSRLQYIIPHRM